MQSPAQGRYYAAFRRPDDFLFTLDVMLPFDPEWLPPTDFAEKLGGAMDGLSCRTPPTKGPDAARVWPNWRPFAPGTRFPSALPCWSPPSTDEADGHEWSPVIAEAIANVLASMDADAGWECAGVIGDSAFVHREVEESPPRSVAAMAWEPSGRLLVTLEWTGELRVWDAITGRQVRSFPHPRAVEPAIFLWGRGRRFEEAMQALLVADRAPGECHILHAHTPGNLSIIDLADLSAVQIGAPIAVNLDAQRVALSATGEFLMTVGFQQPHDVSLWRLATCERVGQLREPLAEHTYSALSPTADFAVLVAGERAVPIVVEWPSGDVVAQLDTRGPVDAIAISPDGRMVATCENCREIRLWEPRSGRLCGQFSMPATDSDSDSDADTNYSRNSTSLLFSPDSQSLVVATGAGNACLIRVADGRELGSIRGAWISPVQAFSPDGRFLAEANRARVRIWRLPDFECLAPSHGSSHHWNVAFMADSQSFASLDSRQTVKIWDFETGQCTGVFGENMGHDIAFSPAGYLMVTNNGMSLGIWSTVTRELLAEIDAGDFLVRVVFSADGYEIFAQRISLGTVPSLENWVGYGLTTAQWRELPEPPVASTYSRIGGISPAPILSFDGRRMLAMTKTGVILRFARRE